MTLINPSFDTVWRRRPSYAIDKSRIHPADREFVDWECNVFRRSLFHLIAPSAFWVNPPETAIQAGYKILQHQVAWELGIQTPDTLYSNDPQQLRTFIRDHGGKIIYKPLRGLPWQNEKSVWMPYTSFLTEDQLVEDHLLHSAPGIYQEFIPKAYELRITVMGRCALAAKILSQEMEGGYLDWRRVPTELKAEPFDLTEDIANRCFEIMRRLGIVFGCFDFIVTPKEELVFLEVNEMGQFLFLEQGTGLPLLDQFSEFLLHGRADFEGVAGPTKISYPQVIDRAKEAIESAVTVHCPAPESFSSEDSG